MSQALLFSIGTFLSNVFGLQKFFKHHPLIQFLQNSFLL